MECKNFEHLIPDFVGRKMDFRTLKEFCSHMEVCEECKEELVIQFLVTEGMQRLEDGDAFDLQNELQIRLNEAELSLRRHKKWRKLFIGLGIMAILAVVGIVLWFVL